MDEAATFWEKLTMPPLIDTKNLSKNYGDSRALDGLNLAVEEGHIVGLLGSNGAGKTTAIHILLGLLTPTSGQAFVFGLSPLKSRHEISKRFNFSSAYVQLPTNLKVRENLNIYSKIYNVKNAAKKIKSLMELFEIQHYLRFLENV